MSIDALVVDRLIGRTWQFITNDFSMFSQVIWKTLYGQTSQDHGTLGYFKSLLNRTTVKNEQKQCRCMP